MSSLTYEFLFQASCEDDSLLVNYNDTTGETRLDITIDADTSTGAVFDFEAADGVHTLKCPNNAHGLVYIGGGNLALLPLPNKPSVLLSDGSTYRWLPKPESEKPLVLGLNDSGMWQWYELSTCEEA